MLPSILKNSTRHYGLVSICLHWLTAITLIGLFFLGDYMVDLDYYDSWYHRAPVWHKSVGILLGLVMIVRIIWNWSQVKPSPLEPRPLFRRLARIAHNSLYLLSVAVLISGYLISTAKGKGIDVFGWFEAPALLAESSLRGDLAGDLHAVISTAFMAFIALHVLATLWHHFILKDRTLIRMLWVQLKSYQNDRTHHE